MIRAAIWASLAVLASCGRAQGVPDQELGGLVVETRAPDKAIDVDAAAREPAELTRALMRPYRAVVAALPRHTLTLTAKTTVEDAGKATDDLDEQTKLELGEGGAFHGEYTNSADYGREVTFAGGTLYLRPRYQRWHGRAPETADEPAALRDGFAAPIAATWELVAPAAELTDLGPAEVAGRKGRKIAVKLSAKPAANPTERLAQRKWREQRVIEELSGEVVLDAEHGAPLSVRLAGTIGFQRDGRRFKMRLKLTSELSAIGTAAAIAAPPAADVVATPERLREVDDRDTLLQGIAPPIRKSAEAAASPGAAAAAATGSGSGGTK